MDFSGGQVLQYVKTLNHSTEAEQIEEYFKRTLPNTFSYVPIPN